MLNRSTSEGRVSALVHWKTRERNWSSCESGRSAYARMGAHRACAAKAPGYPHELERSGRLAHERNGRCACLYPCASPPPGAPHCKHCRQAGRKRDRDREREREKERGGRGLGWGGKRRQTRTCLGEDSMRFRGAGHDDRTERVRRRRSTCVAARAGVVRHGGTIPPGSTTNANTSGRSHTSRWVPSLTRPCVARLASGSNASACTYSCKPELANATARRAGGLAWLRAQSGRRRG